MAAVERVDSSAGTWAWTVAGRVVAFEVVLVEYFVSGVSLTAVGEFFGAGELGSGG